MGYHSRVFHRSRPANHGAKGRLLGRAWTWARRDPYAAIKTVLIALVALVVLASFVKRGFA